MSHLKGFFCVMTLATVAAGGTIGFKAGGRFAGAYAVTQDGVEMTCDPRVPGVAGLPGGSYWSPVPVLNGKTQEIARVSRAVVRGGGDDVTVDLTGAYSVPMLKSCIRHMYVDRAANRVVVEDRVSFGLKKDVEACTFEVPFMSFGKVVPGAAKNVYYIQRGNPLRTLKVEIGVQGGDFLAIEEHAPTHTAPKRVGVRLDRFVSDALVSFTFTPVAESEVVPAVRCVEEHPDSSKWTDLFARDLSNATCAKPGWTWDGEDMLVPGTPETLFTKKDYGSFVLDLEFACDETANSGVFIYDTDHPRSKVEVQLLDDWHPMYLTERPFQLTGSLYGRAPVRRTVMKRAGEWNRMTITAKEQRISVLLNGCRVVDVDMADWKNASVNPDGTPIPTWHKGFPAMGTLPTHGRIGLQGIHGGKAVRFRYLRIKELPKSCGDKKAVDTYAPKAPQWEFSSARLVPDPAAGREISADVHEIKLPSKRSVGWWTTTAKLARKDGVRFSARAEIALGSGEKSTYNDCMMFVTWCDPKYGCGPKRRFYQREFVSYRDTKAADGRIVRTFDQTLPVPGTSDCVRVEFIAKWHPMTVTVSGFKVEEVARPAPRKVRCVVGNPHERRPKSWDDPAAAVAERLAQIEATLTNIFAHVERPDIILFSEVFTDTGTPCPEKTAERIPGGPTFELASRYAKRYRCNIAMNVRERTDEGTYHNSTFIVDRKGGLVGVYRKVTLTSGEYQAGLLPGDDFRVFQLDFGKVGCLTCWDNWFSESFKYTRRLGAELLLFPLAGCAQDHMDCVWPARAIDTGVPILFCTRQGHLPSGVIDRDGTWAAHTYEDNGFACADIDLNERKRTFWLSVGPGQGDPYDLYVNESRPELYERQPLR